MITLTECEYEKELYSNSYSKYSSKSIYDEQNIFNFRNRTIFV